MTCFRLKVKKLLLTVDYDHPMWAMIWKLRVPSKVKICIWRIMQETLPCRVVLANRHMRVSPQCPLCLIGAEDIKHLLFECQRARQASLDASRLGPARAEPAESSSQIWRARASSWSQTSQHKKLGSSQVVARSETSRLASQNLETLDSSRMCTENYLQAFLTQ
jgi:hypothetical protein